MNLKRKAINLLLVCSLVASMLTTGAPLQVEAASGDTGFVKAEGTKFTLDGSDFYYAGTNNYYINFKPAEDVDEVMKDAQDMGITVIRTWGHLDVGTMTDGVDAEDNCPVFTGSVDGKGQKEGVYYQYWDADLGKPVVNHGEDGLQKLDYVIAQAEKHNIKLILTLTNYWDPFGGMGQYCKWAGTNNVEDFYSNETIKGWFKNYIYEMCNHTNVYTGRKLMDEPAIFAWELANEPRYNAQDKAIEDNEIYAWASEMSAYIKSIDKNHMVSVGDEGGMYYNAYDHAGSYPLPDDEGVNTNRQHWHGGMGNFHHLMEIDTIDFATPHLYPGVWNMESEPELAAWLKVHADVAHAAGKPIILEEFGWSNREVAAGVTPYAAGRDTFFEYIYDAMVEYGYAGSNFWMLGAHTLNDAEGYYPDYDGFTVYNFKGPKSADGKDRYGTNEIIKAHAEVMNNMGDKNKISANAVAYDKASPSTCSVTVTPQTGSAIASVALDGVVVAAGSAYSVSNNVITFKADYLNALEETTYYATVDMTKGMSLQFKLTVSDSSIVCAVAGEGTYIFDKNLNATNNVVIPVTVNDGGACKGVYVLEGNTKVALDASAYTISNNSVTINATYLITRDTGAMTVILDYTKGTDPMVGITVVDTTGKDIVDDFEGYASDSALTSAWTRSSNGGNVTTTLVAGENGSTAMNYDFDMYYKGYAGITKAVSGLATSSFDGVSFYIKAENTADNDITVQFREKVTDYESIYWETTYTWAELNAENGAVVKIPFEAFGPKPNEYGGITQPEAGQVCGENAVCEFSVYVGGTTTKNSFVIDDIKLYSEGGIVIVPTPEPTPTPMVEVPPSVLPTPEATEEPTPTPEATEAPTPTPEATVPPVCVTPPATTGEKVADGFYVDGTTIYDAYGNPFEMRGVNIAHAWYKDYTEQSIKGAADLGANAVRIVLADGQQWTKTTAEEVENIIEWCKENEVICVLEVHDATGADGTYALNRAVDYWIELKDLLNANTEYVIVNIANEWYGTWNGSSWAAGYKTAIKNLRDAGINNMLMVDCAGWGQYPQSIKDYGAEVFAADSQANTVFSIHMYEYAAGNANMVRTNIDNALSINAPLVIGEFGGQHTDGDVDELTILSYCEEMGVGYLGWSWKGNNSNLSYLDISNDWDGTSLTTWGDTLFNDTYGIANTSEVCTVFTNGTGGGDNPNATPRPTPTPTPTPTPKPEGILHSGSVNVTGTWWSEKQISMSDLIGDINPADVEKIVFTNDIDFIIGYNKTNGYNQLSGQKEYTLTDVRFDNGYYFKVCISNNDQKLHTIKWDVYGEGSAVATPTPAPTATPTPKPTATPTPAPTATPTPKPTATPTPAPTATPTPKPTATPTPAPTATPTPTPGNDYYVKLEFEKENRFEQNGRNRVDSSMFSGYSGDGYVYLEAGWGEVGFTVPTAGKYRITLVSNADQYKENWLYLDDSGAGTLYTNGNQWNTFTAEYDLSAGTHKFGVSSHWGYTALDYVIVEAVK